MYKWSYYLIVFLSGMMSTMPVMAKAANVVEQLKSKIEITTTQISYQLIEQPIRKSERDNRQYQAIELANNMKVLLISDPQATKSLAALALPVGSLDDPKSQQGLAHYLEHMVLMGSTRYPEPDGFAQFLSKHGGSHNASTASYRTAYYLEVEHNAFNEAVDRLADAVAEPLLDARYSDQEHNAVNAELTMARSRDGMRMGQVDAETLNPLHPTSQFSGGNLETLSDKPQSKLQDELQKFYHHYYSANLMAGVLYSQRDLSELTQLAVSTFGSIKDSQANVKAIHVPAATEREKSLIIHYVPSQPLKQLRIDFRIDNNVDKFRSKTDTYIGYLIGNRSENTLADWLQQQGLADSISAGADPVIDRNGGIFVIAVNLTDKGVANRDLVIAAVFNYLELIKSQGINQHYFDEISHVLALDFRYQSINRDMRYVEDLADTLLRLPIEHVLDGGYLADQYDPNAIQTRLDGMTPQKARIWFISPNEPHNKMAYFVDAPYQIEKISAKRFAKWQQLEKTVSLTLPELNPYIPDDFSIMTKSGDAPKPHWILEASQARAMFMPSQYFTDEPKGDIVVALRNKQEENTAQVQVIASLTDYLADLQLDQLKYQSAVGGINFSLFYSNGLVFKANGFTQHLPDLLKQLVNDYQQFSATEQELAQAKSWYEQQLDSADKAKAYELAMQPSEALNQPYYTERAARRAALAAIKLEDIWQYRRQLLTQATPEIMAIGNFTDGQIKGLAIALQSQLKTVGTQWWHGEDMTFSQVIKATITQVGSSTDSALAAMYVPSDYAEMRGQAYSRLLAQIIHPWFFKQLRTEEQLGYALFAFPVAIGEHWGISFVLQSNSKTPAYLYERYLNFYQQAEQQLSQLSDDDFNQYKQAMITELQEAPQTLSEEAGRYSRDFGRSNYQFNSRERLINEVNAISKQQLLIFFKEAIIEQTGFSFLSQVQGKQEGQPTLDFAQPEGWTKYDSASSLQKQFTTKVRS